MSCVTYGRGGLGVVLARRLEAVVVGTVEGLKDDLTSSQLIKYALNDPSAGIE